MAENEKIEYDEHGLPQPAGGRKESTDDKGKVVRVLEWFGDKFHLLVDVTHEVALAAAPRREGTPSKAILSPIARALRQKIDGAPATAT